jgi:hypothetical protein
MIWVYSAILAFSAGLCTYVFSRVAHRLSSFLGIAQPTQNVLDYAALAALGFLMIGQSPAMMLTSALILWLAGTRNSTAPLSLYVRAGLVMLSVILGLASLHSANFDVPPQIPKAAVMFAIYLVWVLLSFLPLGAPSRGLFLSYGAGLLVIILGVVAVGLPKAIAADAMVLVGVMAAAAVSLTLSNTHATLAGQWVFLFLLGFLMASCVYAGAWWLGLLGIAPICLYALVRKA